MKLFSVILIVFLSIGVIFKNKIIIHREIARKELSDSINVDSMIYITVSSVGDLMCHSTQFNYARINEDSFNFLPCFEYVIPYLQTSDFLMGNLETVLAGTEIPYSGYPQFNAPDDYAYAIKQAGFDFISTANNHANDDGEKGILRTIEVLGKLNMPHTGTFNSQTDRDSIRIINIKGINLGIISYTYSTNGFEIPDDKPWMVNYCDSTLIQHDIFSARKSGAEIVLVIYHFGEEYSRTPSDYQNNFVDYAINCGADIIIGSHPHVIQPAKYFKTMNATLDSGFVAYSLGNFISNQNDEFTRDGIILNIHLSKNLNTNKIKIIKTDYIPTWVFKGAIDENKKLHVIFPTFMASDKTLPQYITPEFRNEMYKSSKNTKDIMSKMSNEINPVN